MPSVGNIALILATVMTLISGFLYVRVWRGRELLRPLARKTFGAVAFFIVIAAATLLYLILTHNFQVGYVYSYSSSDLPLYYLISTFWAGQEGTFLLWIVYLSIIGLFLRRLSGRFEAGNMFFLNLFIFSILIILLKMSPFSLMAQVPAEGRGLNPLLQDFWMTIHPPTMFLGFATASVPFLFAMSALVDRKYTSWTLTARRWTLFAWTVLGIAIVEGGYWAYKVLGWGGFWAWDPVENSSLIPWIFLSAQLHTLFVQQRRQSLTRLAIFMVSLTFSSILYGTFLTRSGVLADFSVHSFVDLGINNFLIGGMAFFVLLAFGLLLWRWREIRNEYPFETILSRDYLVTLGIIILAIGSTLVLLGTSAPLLTRFTEQPRAVEQSYYQITMTPVAIVISLLLALFPFFRWNRGVRRVLLLAGGGVISLVCTIIAYFATGLAPIYLLLLFAILWGLIGNAFYLVDGMSRGIVVGNAVIHIGVLLLFLGALTSSVLEKKTKVFIEKGGTAEAFGYTLHYTGYERIEKEDRFHIAVSHDNDTFDAYLLHAYDTYNDGIMKKPHVEKYLSHDFYLSPVNVIPEEGNHPGLVTLAKGKDTTLYGYTVHFDDFDLDHGDSGPSSVAALVDIAYGDTTESLRPQIRLEQNQLMPQPVWFDSRKGTIFIAGLRPDQGQVILQLVGDFVPVRTVTTPETVVAEVSIKPWISLFWLGAVLMFGGGFVTMAGAPGGRFGVRRKALPGGTEEIFSGYTIPDSTPEPAEEKPDLHA